MTIRHTRPLSLEDSAVIWEEIRNPPADTPARREMLERARRWERRLHPERFRDGGARDARD
ncbi:MAG TPA: hypothetical protein VFQ39_13525 [Longimicrobium sp.]|nr:hypothetical protein [Longimicrobium sp.]